MKRSVYYILLIIVFPFILGVVLRLIVSGGETGYRLYKLNKENDEWYKQLSECESLMIEKGDTACSDTFMSVLSTTVDYEWVIKRRQVLPQIILANKYSYKHAYHRVYQEIFNEMYYIRRSDKLSCIPDSDRFASYQI